MSATVIAVTNQKGGVGKSTTTFHLARAAVKAGRRTLVIDADPQGNLTSVTTAEAVMDDQAGLADVLSARTAEGMRDVLVPGIWEGLDVVPTTGEALGAVRDELVVAGAGREVRLREALAEVRGDYDLVMLDCAPSLDQLTLNCLTAADGAVIVTHTKLFSANGLARLLDSIESVRRYYNASLSVAGVIVNAHEAGTVSGKTWLADLEEAAQGRALPVLHPPIPKRVVISDAVEAARGLDEWGSSEAAALAPLYLAHLRSIEGALA